ncbi:hypothetical protein L2E82_06939 [Cichorium intybus]|uniref:Uncharacterized protein n=1 Tax=Cichorium intybus TaxID=13427 RepID=A0ACB9G4K2_CICIN|nr:hypothetical protein L2E82_06939 [Cichorium intybus]
MSSAASAFNYPSVVSRCCLRFDCLSIQEVLVNVGRRDSELELPQVAVAGRPKQRTNISIKSMASTTNRIDVGFDVKGINGEKWVTFGGCLHRFPLIGGEDKKNMLKGTYTHTFCSLKQARPRSFLNYEALAINLQINVPVVVVWEC